KSAPFSLKAVRDAIGRLYATGRYSDVVVEASLEGGQVALRFVTQSNWFIGGVSVSSVPQPPSPGQLVNSTNLNLGNPFHAEDFEQSERGLRQVMAGNGYFHPELAARVTREPRTQEASVDFTIKPGARARFGPPNLKGDLRRPASEVARESHWRGWFGWRPLTEDRVQRGLERILQSYRKRDYLMARVTLEGIDPATGSPTVEINAGPRVLIESTGAKVSGGRLQRLLPIYQEQAVDRELLMEGARDLTEYFQTQGYFDAKVQFSTTPVSDNLLRIVYSIERGRRQKLVQVEIRGNRYFDLKTLRERMLTIPASLQVRRGHYSKSLLEQDVDSITALYRSNGFREVKVGSRVESDFRGRKGEVAVFLDIDEGGQWFVSSLGFEGLSPEIERDLRNMLQSGPGQVFSEANVAADRDNILAYLFNRGFPNASFEWGYKDAAEPCRADLLFAVSLGPQQFVREVLIGGLKTTHPQLVNRRVGINVGDPVSQAQLLATQRRLYDLGIFAKVDMAVQNPDGEERNKFVLLRLEESRKYSVAFGFGAQVARIGGSQRSLESPAGKAGFSPSASFDLSRLNFFGRAHTVSLRSRLSGLQQRGLITYTAPQFRSRANLDLSFTGLFDSSRNVRTFSSRRWEGFTQIAHRWTRSRTLFYRFAYRRVGVDQGTLKIRSELIPLLSQPVRVGVFSASYLDDRRDDPTDSRRGTYNSLDLGTATKLLGSETDYFRLLGRNSTYHRIGSKLVLARTMSFGLMQTLRRRPELPPSPQDIPLPERFFAGGASTHRGFPENQAGPRDPLTGFPLGGKALLTFGTELRFPLWGHNIGGVLFHDAGNVYSGLPDISFRWRQRDKTDFDYMAHAAGLGFRYRTPIGPVRVDFAFVPNSPRFRGCRGTQQELLFGACEPTDQRINRFQFHFSLGQTF
ncbi:MAG TPA: BamA/TamA family outer membrane protein, partial [Bryobacteraceae bacterium]|nr:BamA/TamA family outer membrane protein [Bryobacteraceae bacterium]